MSSRGLTVGLAAACAAAFAASCSSAGSTPAATPSATESATPLSAAAYRSALHQVAQQENTAQHQVQRAFHARKVAQVRAALTAFGSDQRHAAQRVGAITPPANATTANAQLARAFSDNSTAIDSLLAKLGGATTVKQSLRIIQNDRQAQQVGGEIDSALAKLKRLGYTSAS